MINKSKLLICIIAIATILISTSSGFADVVIPGFAIKSNYIVGDKSGAEYVYHGEMITLVGDDVSIIVQAGTEKKKMKLAVKNEKLKENLLELYEKKSMRYGRYKFYLKDEIDEGAELLAVERIIGEKDCGTYYLADKSGDGWIFGYRLNLECDSESKNVNYFSLELSDEFFKVYSGYDIDEVFERFKGIPADIFIDNDGKLTGFLNEDEEN